MLRVRSRARKSIQFPTPTLLDRSRKHPTATIGPSEEP